MIGYRYFRAAEGRRIVKKKISTLVESPNEGILFENERECRINLQGSVESIIELDQKSEELNRTFDEYAERRITRDQLIIMIKDITDIDVKIGR